MTPDAEQCDAGRDRVADLRYYAGVLGIGALVPCALWLVYYVVRNGVGTVLSGGFSFPEWYLLLFVTGSVLSVVSLAATRLGSRDG